MVLFGGAALQFHSHQSEHLLVLIGTILPPDIHLIEIKIHQCGFGPEGELFKSTLESVCLTAHTDGCETAVEHQKVLECGGVGVEGREMASTL